ncbi:GGDEF domain-containing protein [uncultured Sphingomonas sp.]|uniref:GGDEF domain-containing protein n=1 Tax=uncultured Sphingomonas sp. TaxID=158754 RepID=UPI0025DD289C|nr:GGDEF domain-containing protein [uncultured Sphingomonas sp.]
MSYTQPQFSPASRLVARALDAAAGWGNMRSVMITAMTLGASLLANALLDRHVSLALFYIMTCAFSAWTLGEKAGLWTAATAMIGSSLINYLRLPADVQQVTLASEIWNLVIRTLSAFLIVTMVSGFRTALSLERWRGSVDSLTGVLNKAAFSGQVPRFVAMAAAGRRVLLLFYIDLDGFKQVNDRHGHSAGDQVLASFAEAASDAIRAGDLFARIGGDEFVGLMAVRTRDEADTLAEMVHTRLSRILRDMDLGVGCSTGALVFEAPASGSLDPALKIADALMYEVKRSGKNAMRIGHIIHDENAGKDVDPLQFAVKSAKTGFAHGSSAALPNSV